jgi:hypothetical protein
VKDQLCHKISRKITCPNVVLREINANVRVEFSMAVRLIVKFKKSIRNTKVTIIKVKKNIPSTALLNSLGLRTCLLSHGLKKTYLVQLTAAMTFLEMLLEASQSNATVKLRWKVLLLSNVDQREMNVFVSVRSTMDSRKWENTPLQFPSHR